MLVISDDDHLGHVVRAALPDSVAAVAEHDDESEVEVAVIVVTQKGRGSQLARAIAARAAITSRLVDRAVSVVVALSGPVRRFESVLRRFIAPEMAYQVEIAATPSLLSGPRRLGVRFRQASLQALGIDVYRISSSTTRTR